MADDDILALRSAFDEAELAGDAGQLGALLADDFQSIGEQGFVLGKSEWIARHADFRYLAVDTTEVDVRRYQHAAVVRCVQRSRATWRGREMSLSVRMSQVWVELPDGWRLAALQFSSLGGA